MKKIFSMVAVVLLAFGATPTAKAQFRWGVKAGANFSTASLNVDKMKSEYLTAFHIGPTAEFKAGILPLAVEGSLLFSQRGVKIAPDTELKELGDGFLRTNNLEIPLNAKVYFGALPVARFFLFAGPSFNFNLSHSLTDAYEKRDRLQDFEMERFGVSLNAGFGLQLLKMLQISASYNASLTNDYKFKNVGQSAQDFIKAKEKGFSLSATVLF